MIGRVWTTLVDEVRVVRARRLAADVPSLAGFRDVAMFRRGEECVVVTLWRDTASVANLPRPTPRRSLRSLRGTSSMASRP